MNISHMPIQYFRVVLKIEEEMGLEDLIKVVYKMIFEDSRKNFIICHDLIILYVSFSCTFRARASFF